MTEKRDIPSLLPPANRFSRTNPMSATERQGIISGGGQTWNHAAEDRMRIIFGRETP